MNKINCLFCLIKQKAYEKMRKLKVIVDWDETLQPVNPVIWYEIVKEKGWYEGNLPPLEDWFVTFWEQSNMEFGDRGGESIKTGATHIKQIREWPESERRKAFMEILNRDKYYEEVPFLGIAESLLKCLEDDLISSIVFVTSSTDVQKRKRNKFAKSFGKFANASIQILDPNLSKFEEINKNNSDFDIYVDDNPKDISKTRANYSDRIYIMPNYEYVHRDLWGVKDIFITDNNCTSLKDEDFTGKVKVNRGLRNNSSLINWNSKRIITKEEYENFKNNNDGNYVGLRYQKANWNSNDQYFEIDGRKLSDEELEADKEYFVCEYFPQTEEKKPEKVSLWQRPSTWFFIGGFGLLTLFIFLVRKNIKNCVKTT